MSELSVAFTELVRRAAAGESVRAMPCPHCRRQTRHVLIYSNGGRYWYCAECGRAEEAR